MFGGWFCLMWNLRLTIHSRYEKTSVSSLCPAHSLSSPAMWIFLNIPHLIHLQVAFNSYSVESAQCLDDILSSQNLVPMPVPWNIFLPKSNCLPQAETTESLECLEASWHSQASPGPKGRVSPSSYPALHFFFFLNKYLVNACTEKLASWVQDLLLSGTLSVSKLSHWHMLKHEQFIRRSAVLFLPYDDCSFSCCSSKDESRYRSLLCKESLLRLWTFGTCVSLSPQFYNELYFFF